MILKQLLDHYHDFHYYNDYYFYFRTTTTTTELTRDLKIFLSVHGIHGHFGSEAVSSLKMFSRMDPAEPQSLYRL